MSHPELFYTPAEVAEMFRSSTTALNSQRKRGIQPGSLAVKVGGKHLYPKTLIDHYLGELARKAQDRLDLDEGLTAELFRLPPTNRRTLSLAEAATRLSIDETELLDQWENDVLPGALGWRPTPGSELVFVPRDIDIWTQARAHQSRQDTPSPQPQ